MLERTKIDAYMALKAEQKRVENAIKEMEATIKEDMLASGVNKVEGTDGYVRLQVVEDKVMPAKEAYVRKGYSCLKIYK